MGLFTRLTGRGPKVAAGRLTGFAELVAVPAMSDLPPARLQSPARYLGTFTEAGVKVVGRTLAAKSSSRLHLSAEALDVVRVAGSFRVPVPALLGATTADSFSGTPADALLVVRWEHDGQEWHTGFALQTSKNLKSGTSAPDVDRWVRTISKMARKTAEGR